MTDAERIDKLRRALAAAGSEISGLQDGDYMAPPPVWIQKVLDETWPGSPIAADGFPDRMPTGHDGSLDG